MRFLRVQLHNFSSLVLFLRPIGFLHNFSELFFGSCEERGSSLICLDIPDFESTVLTPVNDPNYHMNTLLRTYVVSGPYFPSHAHHDLGDMPSYP